MNFKRSNKAPLSKILSNRLANERASKDLVGMSGVSGSFTYSQVSGATTMTHAETLTVDVPTPLVVTPTITVTGTVEVQHIAFSAVPEYHPASTWTLDYDGDVTTPMAYNADAAAVEAALRAIGGGTVLPNVTVAGDYAAGFDVTMTGVGSPILLAAPANDLNVNDQAVTLTTTVDNLAVTERQLLEFGAEAASGSFVISYDGVASPAPVAWDASLATVAASIETQLRTFAGLSALTVTAVGATWVAGFSITFVGFAGPALAITVDSTLLLDGAAAPVTNTVSVPTPGELQVVSISPDFTGYQGDWIFGYDAANSVPIAWNSALVSIQTAIRNTDPALAAVTCTGLFTALDPLVITFNGVAGSVGTSSTNTVTLESTGTAVVTTPSVGTPFVPGQEIIAFSQEPTAGTWGFSYGAYAVAGLNFNDPAAIIEAALQGVDPIFAAVTVAGDYTLGFTFTFTGVALPLTLFTIPAHTLTYDVTTPVTINIAGSNNQAVTFSAVPDAGTWTLTYGLLGDTGPLAFNANAAAVELAIRAIDPSLALMTVVGDYVAGFTCAFLGVAVTECVDVVGKGFTVVPDVVDGAFNVYFEKNPKEILFAKASAHAAKAVAANSDTYELDVSGFAADVSPAYVTFRFVEKAAPHTVIVPLVDMLVNFEIKCVYSDIDLI